MKTFLSKLRPASKTDRGNMPSAAVFIVVLGLIIAATASAISTASYSIRSSTASGELLQKQVAGVMQGEASLLENLDAKTPGDIKQSAEGFTKAYRIDSSNKFLGYNTAGEEVWEKSASPDPYIFSKLEVSGDVTCALTPVNKGTGGIPYCWGTGTNGLGGNGVANFSAMKPTKTAVNASAKGYSDIQAFPGGFCGRTIGNNHVYCWGKNNTKNFGTATSVNTPTRLGTVVAHSGANWFAANENTTCVILSTQVVSCNGEMDGDTTTSTSMKNLTYSGVAIKAKNLHMTTDTMIIESTTNQVFGMSRVAGTTAAGIAGSHTTPVTTPTPIVLPGAALPADEIQLVKTHQGDSAQVRINGALYGFGYTWKGDGTNPGKVEAPIRMVPTLHVLKAHQTSRGHTCATIDTDTATNPGGEVTKCWGLMGTYMEKTPDDSLAYGFYDFEHGGFDTLCGFTSDTYPVQCWGANAGLNIGRSNSSTNWRSRVAKPLGENVKPKDASINDNAVCVLAQNGNLWCWGNNINGGANIGFKMDQWVTPSRVYEDTATGKVNVLHQGG